MLSSKNMYLRAALFGLIGLFSFGVPQAQAQSCRAQQSLDPDYVCVVMWPLNAISGTMHGEVVAVTEDVLNAIRKSSQPQHPAVSATVASQMAQTFNGVYSVRKGPARKYIALVVPIPEEPWVYEVRGLHLLKEGSAEEYPQAVIRFRMEDDDLRVEQVYIQTKADREGALDAKMNMLADRDAARAEEVEKVFNLVRQFGASYNFDGETIYDEMAKVLSNENDVQIQESGIDENGNAALGTPKSAQTYINAIRGRNVRLGEIEITYELVDVFAIPDQAGVYRATVVQHYMHENKGTYLDSDFLAIDINIENGEPIIKKRLAGRGSFQVQSAPAGMEVTRYNGQNWPVANLKVYTPFEHIVNAPLQYHFLNLDNVWYQEEPVIINPEDVQFQRETTVTMTHLPGNVIVNVTPPEEGNEETTLWIGDAQDGQPQENGETVGVAVEDLQLVPDAAGSLLPPDDPTRDDREVRVRVQREHYEPHDDDYTLKMPEPPVVINIELERQKGFLTVKSTPDASPFQVTLDAPSFLKEGTTEETMELDVTGNRNPYEVAVWNNEKHAATLGSANDRNDQDYIRYLPDYQSVEIAQGETAVVEANLRPLHVQHKTNKGMLDVTDARLVDGALSVDYNLVDNNDRNRKYHVTLSLVNGDETMEVINLDEIQCDDDEIPCAGKGMRQGATGFVWNVGDSNASLASELMNNPNVHPVLTLSRKGLTCNWACVLIPAAAGVASAFIWPRTGKGGDDGTFIPPPRP